MAHKEEHKKVTGWIREEEAQALEALAKRNDRSQAAEIRIAIRSHLALCASLDRGPVTLIPAEQES